MPKEFLVNSYSGQWQEHPQVARLADGGFWVVWDSYYSDIGEDSFYYIGAQRYSATGARIGNEVVIDSDMGGLSRHASITGLSDGGFAVAWENSEGTVLAETDIYTRTFDANGKARGESTLAHLPDGESQYAVSISATSGGGYLMSYTSYEGPQVGRTDDIFLQRFDADGDRLGAARKVNQETDFDQKNSQMTTLSNGDVLVVWDSEYAGAVENPGSAGFDAVRGRIYHANGLPKSNEFMVADHNSGVDGAVDATNTSMDVEALAGGRFVATWYETVLHDDRDTTFEIRGQVFSGSGKPSGAEFIVRSDSEGVPRHSSITALDGGGFVVAWDAPNPSFSDSFARVYDSAGRPLGGAFALNPPSRDYDEELPELEALDGGGFVAVYESEELDGDDDAIGGRIFGQGTNGADVETMLWRGRFEAFAGDDRVNGSAGADLIFGGTGDDTLDGGAGADRLEGGSGADLFLFKSAWHASLAAPDRIAGFDARFDTLHLAGVDADATRAGNQRFDFVGAKAFSGEAGELRYAGGRLLGDLDGDRRAEFEIVGQGFSADAIIL